ncbi:MAG: hypothetical protein ACE5EI_02500 [Thermodesulfobacteriota bacterium]
MARKMDFMELITFWESQVEADRASGRPRRRRSGYPLEEGVFFMVDDSYLLQLSDNISES